MANKRNADPRKARPRGEEEETQKTQHEEELCRSRVHPDRSLDRGSGKGCLGGGERGFSGENTAG